MRKYNKKKKSVKLKRYVNKTRKIYASDRIIPYNIHKITSLSFNPIKSCEAIQNLFGKNNVSKIRSPPDAAIKARGAKWVRCLKGGKAEFHYLPPYKLKHDKLIRKIIKEEEQQHPYNSQFFENHVGIYVPDLTNICIRAQKHKYKFYLVRRADGLHQFYVNIPGGIDFLEIDSLKIDLSKLVKHGIIEHSFGDALKTGKKFERMFKNKKQKLSKKRVYKYYDPKHNGAPRKVILYNNKLTISGRDGPNKKVWRIHGKTKKNKKAILDFSSKGGPKKIKATISKKQIKFSDGNTWYTSSI